VETAFSRQNRGEGDKTVAVMDEDYVEAIEYAMPPAGEAQGGPGLAGLAARDGVVELGLALTQAARFYHAVRARGGWAPPYGLMFVDQ
jgi:hypothetical protein